MVTTSLGMVPPGEREHWSRKAVPTRLQPPQPPLARPPRDSGRPRSPARLAPYRGHRRFDSPAAVDWHIKYGPRFAHRDLRSAERVTGEPGRILLAWTETGPVGAHSRDDPGCSASETAPEQVPWVARLDDLHGPRHGGDRCPRHGGNARIDDDKHPGVPG